MEMRRQPDLPPARRAFTLIELVLVMAIVADLAAITTPRFAAATTRYRAEAAARRVRDDLARARTYAKITGASYTVTFDAAAATYSFPVPPAKYNVPAQPGAGLPGDPVTVSIGGEPYNAAITAVDFASAAAVTFNGYGAPSSGGTVTVQVGDTTQTVTLDGQTGEVTVP